MSSRAVGAHGGHQSFLPSEAPSSAVTLGAVPNHVGTVLLASCQRALVGSRSHGGARDRKAEVSHQRTSPVGATNYFVCSFQWGAQAMRSIDLFTSDRSKRTAGGAERRRAAVSERLAWTGGCGLRSNLRRSPRTFCSETEDTKKGIRAFVEKRERSFSGPLRDNRWCAPASPLLWASSPWRR